MAKKKIPGRPSRKKADAAPPLDIASVTGTEPRGNGGTIQPTHDEIAEAAYFRHLRRGGGHGSAFNDWIEAERELRQRQRHRPR